MENQLIVALRNNKLLNNCNISNLDFTDIKGNFITLSEGQFLFKEGDNADFIFLVLSGEINLLRKQNIGKTISYVFGENEFLGEDEFLKQINRTTTAVAIADSYIIELTKEEVTKLIDQDHGVAINLSINTPVEDPDSIEDYVDEKLVEEIFDESLDNNLSEKNTLNNEQISIDDISELVQSEIIDDGIDNILNENILEQNLAAEITDKINHNKFDLDEQIINEPEITEDNIIEGHDDSGTEITSAINLPGDENPQEEPLSKDERPFEDSFDEKFDLSDLSINEDETGIEHVEKLLNDLEDEEHQELTDDLVTDETDDVEEYLDKNFENSKGEDDMLNEQLEMIIKAAQLVNSNITLDDVLKNIVDVAVDLTNADRGTLYLVDKKNRTLWSKVLMGDELKEIHLKFGEGVAGWVAEKGEIVNISDVRSDKRFKESFDKESGYKTETMLCYPIRNKREEIIGVLQLLNSAKGGFSQNDEWFINALSVHAALALENASLVEKLLETERTSSLGKMGSFLIQDIKKPILVSKRYAEHLSQKNLPREIKQVVEMLLEQLNQVADLVLTTSNFTEDTFVLRKEDTSLNDTLNEYSNKMEPYLRANNCLIVTEFDKDVNVNLDSKEFYQCFNNVVKNAAEALPEGGNILITTKKDSGNVKISFEDRGVGIPESQLDKVFEPLITFKDNKGPGLGLSITKKIVEDHNGTISISSKVNEGTTVVITLPAA
ncbi:sporulation kinase A [bacterium BMS3Abin04]|nr:sporulation kinase A [bacterium BMS3Abin04]